MSFESDVMGDLDLFFDLGDPGVVMAASGGGSMPVCIIERVSAADNIEANGELMVVEVRVSDCARPTKGQAWSITGQAWHVDSIGGGPESGVWRLHLLAGAWKRL